MTTVTRGDRERGSAVIEAVIAIPAFVLFVVVIIAAGRVAMAHQSVEAAAAESARSASLARTAGEAQAKATAAGAQTLINQGLQCVSTTLTVDTSGFGVPVGSPAQVSATVTCAVDLGDLTMTGLPGTITVDATVGSPLDTYRGR